MKKLITTIALFINISTYSDTISVDWHASYYKFETGTGISIKSIEQYPEGLLVVVNNGGIGSTGGALPPSVIRSSSPVYVQGVPSIAVFNVITAASDSLQDRIPGIKVYDEVAPDVVVPLDFDLLNDWIDVIGFGMINIKNYPWIIHQDYGVFYISDSLFVNGQLGYWIHKESYGWLWTTRDQFPRMFSIDLEEWFTLL